MRASWTRPYTTAAESFRAASNKRSWTVYIYWPVSLLLTLIRGTVACRTEHRLHNKRQMPNTNCSITNQLLADFSGGTASCAQSRPSTRLQAAADCGSGKTASLTKMGLEVTVAESLPAGSGEDSVALLASYAHRGGCGTAKCENYAKCENW